MGILLGKRLQDGYLLSKCIQSDFVMDKANQELGTEFLTKEEKQKIEAAIKLSKGDVSSLVYDTYSDLHYIGWYSIQRENTIYLNDFQFHQSKVCKY